MLEFLAEKLSLKLVTNNIIDENKREYYTYGIELVLNDTMIFLMIGIIAVITNTVLISLIFSISFCCLRAFTGGYHSKSYLGCFCTAFINYISMLILTHLIFSGNYVILECIMMFASVPIILKFSPVENFNSPLDILERKKYRNISYILISLYMLIFIINIKFFPSILSVVIAWSVFSTAALMLFSIILQRKERKINERESS